MIVADYIVGDAEFEYSSGELHVIVNVRDGITDTVVPICVSAWVIEALQAAVLRALEIMLVSHVDKDQIINGTLHQGIEE